MNRSYPEEAIERAAEDALDWLLSEGDGYPRSWGQEVREAGRRGYALYDDFEAPPIAGYEKLERDGRAVRVGLVSKGGNEERVHFKLNSSST